MGHSAMTQIILKIELFKPGPVPQTKQQVGLTFEDMPTCNISL
jgi:hypothetical protein